MSLSESALVCSSPARTTRPSERHELSASSGPRSEGARLRASRPQCSAGRPPGPGSYFFVLPAGEPRPVPGGWEASPAQSLSFKIEVKPAAGVGGQKALLDPVVGEEGSYSLRSYRRQTLRPILLFLLLKMSRFGGLCSSCPRYLEENNDCQDKTAWVEPKATVGGMGSWTETPCCFSYGGMLASMLPLGADEGLQPLLPGEVHSIPGRPWLGLVAKLGSVITLILRKLDLNK